MRHWTLFPVYGEQTHSDREDRRPRSSSGPPRSPQLGGRSRRKWGCCARTTRARRRCPQRPFLRLAWSDLETTMSSLEQIPWFSAGVSCNAKRRTQPQLSSTTFRQLGRKDENYSAAVARMGIILSSARTWENRKPWSDHGARAHGSTTWAQLELCLNCSVMQPAVTWRRIQ